MANNKQRSGGKNTGLKVFASIVSVLLAASVITTGVCFGTGAWQVTPKDETQQEQPGEETGGELVVSNIVAQSMKLTAAPLAAGETTSPINTAVTLNATVLPEEATDKTVTWTVAWLSSADSWATGKDVNDYVTLSATTGNSITVTATQTFGEEIIVRAEANGGENVRASCQLDCIKQITGVSATFYDSMDNEVNTADDSTINDIFTVPDYWADDIGDGDDDQSAYVFSKAKFEFTYSTGTVTEDYKIDNIVFDGDEVKSSGNHNANNIAAVSTYTEGATVTFRSLTWYEIGDIFGCQPVVNAEDARWLYENNPAATLKATFTGLTSGHTFSISYSASFDFSTMYVYATNVNLNHSNVIFY